ncbi:MAG: hypothetical protein K2X01_06480 [Cyanobacteria bacterium]|nr:hypothetical protein [Cyanobacteriota bacterium]
MSHHFNKPLSTLNPEEAVELAFLNGLDISVQKLGLSRMARLCEHYGHPELAFPFIHVAGTNGKGSTVAMLSSILHAAGYNTGATISPHLIEVQERIQLNGQPISRPDFAHILQTIRTDCKKSLPREDWPTYFECLILMAFLYFRELHEKEKLDIALIEVGLGGRLDATNIIPSPLLTVITHIGWDHMTHLGDTLEKIATEKAGIIKAGSPLVLGPQITGQALGAIQDRASQANASKVIQASSESLTWLSLDTNDSPPVLLNQKTQQQYKMPLQGLYQKDNLATVLASIEQLNALGYAISEEAIIEGLASVSWPVRFQSFPQRRLFLDGSHNVNGMETLAETIATRIDSALPLMLILSLQENRVIETTLAPLLKVLSTFNNPQNQFYCIQGPESHRYHAGAALHPYVEERLSPNWSVHSEFHLSNLLELDKADSLLSSWNARNPEGFCIMTGSLYTAGLFLKALREL